MDPLSPDGTAEPIDMGSSTLAPAGSCDIPGAGGYRLEVISIGTRVSARHTGPDMAHR